jgi:GTP-binding protein
MEQRLRIAVVINKIDRPDERIEEVKHEIEELFLELASMLNIEDFDLDIPIIYSSARAGWATHDPKVVRTDINPILDLMVSDFFPSPRVSEGPELQLLVTNLSYSPYLGPLAIGRIQRGSIRKGGQYTLCDADKKNKNYKITAIQEFSALAITEVENADAGEIVIVAGIDNAKIGDTIVATTKVEPLPRITVEPPTVGVQVSVSTSPMSGQEGEYLTSRKLEEFLQDSIKTNVALQYEGTDDPKVFILKGRGELQLAIVFEQLRRKGFELMVGRPQVLFQTSEAGDKLEPFEKVVLDIPNESTGAITERLSSRKGVMENMMPLGDTRTRMVFIIPSRGLIGYRGIFLTDTRGAGLMSSEFIGYRPYTGDMLGRQNGALVSDRAGKMTPYALYNLLSSGKQFVKPGEMTYEGMVIGEATRPNDLVLNCVREKHLTSVRTAGKDEQPILPPIVNRTLEWALDWIDNDEWVEITPQSIRIRKKELVGNKRSVVRKG